MVMTEKKRNLHISYLYTEKQFINQSYNTIITETGTLKTELRYPMS